MLMSHRALGTWTKAVDLYIALTEFSRRRFIEAGLPADRIIVKPNFLNSDPGLGSHTGEFALFVGRLAPGKGVHTLLRAWRLLITKYPLKIVGDGPLRHLERDRVANVEWLGQLPKDRVIALMKEARFLVFPSGYYESFPVTLLEAFATALPVLVPGHGAIAEIVVDGQTGRYFRRGDHQDLASLVSWAWGHAEEMAAMGGQGRAQFVTRYSPTQNYDMLMRSYEVAGHNRLMGKTAS